MNPVIPRAEVGGKPIIIAENQPQYRPLPALVDDQGAVWTEWELSMKERMLVAEGARIRLQVLTFGQPLQTVMLTVEGYEPEPPVGTPR